MDKPMLITLTDAECLARREAKLAFWHGVFTGILIGLLAGIVVVGAVVHQALRVG